MPINGVKHNVTKNLIVKLSVNFFIVSVIKPKGYELKKSGYVLVTNCNLINGVLTPFGYGGYEGYGFFPYIILPYFNLKFF